MPEERSRPDETAAEPVPPQDAAGELVQMGIDPAVVGLDEPSTVMLPPLPETPGWPDSSTTTTQRLPSRGWPYLPSSGTPPGGPVSAPPGGAPPGSAPPSGGPVSAHPVGAPVGPVAASGSVTALSRPLAAAPPAPATATPDRPVPNPLFPESFGLVVPAGWRRLLRAATVGLIAPGAAAAMEYERTMVARVRTRLGEPRTVLFVAGKGGVGTTTTGIGVSHTLATLRTDQTVLVDSRIGTRSLGERVAEMRAPSTLDLADGTDRRGPLAFRSRLHLVDAPPWHLPLDAGRLGQLLGRLRDGFQFIGVDTGNDSGDVGQAALGRADQVVIVTSTSRDAVAAIRVALGRIQHTNPSRLDTVVVAVVSTTGRGHQKTVRALHDELGLEPSRIVVIPYDRGLVAGDRFDPDRLRTVTREAYLRLAALVADPSPLRPAPAHPTATHPTPAHPAAAQTASGHPSPPQTVPAHSQPAAHNQPPFNQSPHSQPAHNPPPHDQSPHSQPAHDAPVHNQPARSAPAQHVPGQTWQPETKPEPQPEPQPGPQP